MSHTDPSTQSPDRGHTPDNPPILRREAMVGKRDRGRFAVVFSAMFAVAALTIGVGVSTHRLGTCSLSLARTPSIVGCEAGCTWLGVRMRDTPAGVVVVGIFPGTPAAELAASGLLRPGDIIEAIGERPVRRGMTVVEAIRRQRPGGKIGMRLRRRAEAAVVMLEAELGWLSGPEFRRLQSR